MNDTKNAIEDIAAGAGWDSYTLLLLVCRWIEENGHAEALVTHMHELSNEQDEIE